MTDEKNNNDKPKLRIIRQDGTQGPEREIPGARNVSTAGGGEDLTQIKLPDGDRDGRTKGTIREKPATSAGAILAPEMLEVVPDDNLVESVISYAKKAKEVGVDISSFEKQLATVQAWKVDRRVLNSDEEEELIDTGEAYARAMEVLLVQVIPESIKTLTENIDEAIDECELGNAKALEQLRELLDLADEDEKEINDKVQALVNLATAFRDLENDISDKITAAEALKEEYKQQNVAQKPSWQNRVTAQESPVKVDLRKIYTEEQLASSTGSVPDLVSNGLLHAKRVGLDGAASEEVDKLIYALASISPEKMPVTVEVKISSQTLDAVSEALNKWAQGEAGLLKDESKQAHEKGRSLARLGRLLEEQAAIMEFKRTVEKTRHENLPGTPR